VLFGRTVSAGDFCLRDAKSRLMNAHRQRSQHASRVAPVRSDFRKVRRYLISDGGEFIALANLQGQIPPTVEYLLSCASPAHVRRPALHRRGPLHNRRQRSVVGLLIIGVHPRHFARVLSLPQPDTIRNEVREYPEYIVPHSDHGDSECCGLILPVLRGDIADFVCNECGVVIRSVSVRDADRVLSEMSLDQGFATEMCPHCRQVNILPGFTDMIVFTCRYCGRAVDVSSRGRS
jgi:hypothetical protein